jgi:hypothetical protein
MAPASFLKPGANLLLRRRRGLGLRIDGLNALNLETREPQK